MYRSRVLLPNWVFSDDKRTKPIMEKVEQYMQRYPDYVVFEVKNGFAICDRLGGINDVN